MTDKPVSPEATITEDSESTEAWPRFLVTAPPGYRFGVGLYSIMINGPRADAERFASAHPCVPDTESTDAEVTLDVEPPKLSRDRQPTTRHARVDWNDPEIAGELSPLSEFKLLEMDRCLRCSECVGQEHHWLESDEVYGPGDPEFMCKHCVAVCDGVDTPDGLMVPSGIARTSRRNDPKIATKIRDLPHYKHAALYRCDPPLCGATFVVATAGESDGAGQETLLLEASEDGVILFWGNQLDGSYAGGADHEAAFAGAGYQIASDALDAPKPN